MGSNIEFGCMFDDLLYRTSKDLILRRNNSNKDKEAVKFVYTILKKYDTVHQPNIPW